MENGENDMGNSPGVLVNTTERTIATETKIKPPAMPTARRTFVKVVDFVVVTSFGINACVD